MGADEQTLLARYRMARDAEAFHEIVVRHQDMVFATCRRILGNAADAEDAAQTCFLTLARRPERVRRSLAGWLHRAAVGSAIDLLRRDRARRAREGKAMQGKPSTAEGSWDDLAPAIDEAIERLPNDLRIPVIRHFLEGRTQEAIAEELGVTHSAVSKRLQRATLVLRRRLTRSGFTLSAAVIASLLTAHAAEAAPATLQATLGKVALATLAEGGRAAVSFAWLGAVRSPAVLVVLVAALLAGFFVMERKAQPEARRATAPGGVAVAPDHAGVAFWAAGLTEARAAELRRFAKPLALESTGEWKKTDLKGGVALQCDAAALLRLMQNGLAAADVVMADKVELLRTMPSYGLVPRDRFGEVGGMRLLGSAQVYDTTAAGKRVWGALTTGGGYWLKREKAGARIRLRFSGSDLDVEHTGVLPPGGCWFFLAPTSPATSQGIPWHLYVVQVLVMTPQLEKALSPRIDNMRRVDGDAFIRLLTAPAPAPPPR